MLKASWLIALAFGVATFGGLLVSTEKQRTIRDRLALGVSEAEQVVGTTDEALRATDELPVAREALGQGLPQVAGTAAALRSADHDLGRLSGHLEELGRILAAADPPLAGVLGSGGQADEATGAAKGSVAGVIPVLDRAQAALRDIASLLDETIARVARIEAKVRTFRAVPAGG